MDGYRIQGQRTAEARTRDLMWTIVEAGPVADAYLAAQTRREWAMAAVESTVGESAASAFWSRGRRWLGTLLVMTGQRLQDTELVGQTVTGPVPAVEPGSAS